MSYADSLRQQAAWIREALDPNTPDTQRITLDDIDVDELEEAAKELDALAARLPDTESRVKDAFMHHIQRENACTAAVTGKPCRSERCGCAIELQAYIDEQLRSDK